MWEDAEGLMLLLWSALFVGERVMRWEMWEGGGKVGIVGEW